MELFSYTLEVLTGEFLSGAGLVLAVAELSFVASVATVVVVIAEPIFIEASSVVAQELIFGAGQRRRTVMHRNVLVGTVHAVGIAVAEPLSRYALCSAPHFVRRAREFRFFVALPVVCKINTTYQMINVE